MRGYFFPFQQEVVVVVLVVGAMMMVVVVRWGVSARAIVSSAVLVYCRIKGSEQKLVNRAISHVCCPEKTFKTQRRLRGF